MSEAALTKIKTEVRSAVGKTQEGIVSLLSSLSIIPSPQCTRIEAELGLYKNAVPMTEACELCVLLLYPL